MPGMMETLLNIGLCDATVPGSLPGKQATLVWCGTPTGVWSPPMAKWWLA